MDQLSEFKNRAQYYITSIMQNQIPMRAASLTYTFILALVPAIAVCLYLVSLFIDVQNVQTEIQSFLVSNLASGPSGSIAAYLDNFLNNTNFQRMGAYGFMLLFVTAILLISSVEEAINQVWQIPVSENWQKRVGSYLLLFILGPLTLAFSIFVTTFIKSLFPHLFIGAKIIAILAGTALFSIIFAVLPNTKVKIKHAILTGFIVTISSHIAKAGFTFYTTQTEFYKTIYGSLAVLPLFLFWIYLNWLIILSGAQLTFLLQNRRKLATLGYKGIWKTGPLFQSQKFNMIQRILKLLKNGARNRNQLAKELDIPGYAIDSCLDWLLYRNLVKSKRVKLRFIYTITDKLDAMSAEEFWRAVLGDRYDFSKKISNSD